MGILTFKGGVHPYDGKELSKNSPVVKYLPKGDMVYPLSQHIGAPATPTVAVGDTVKMGQIIGEASGFISANIVSSVSGTVKKIEPRLTGSGAKATCVVIENDGEDTPVEGLGEDRDYTTLSKEEIRQIIGADSLSYLRMDRLPELSEGLPICTACFSGDYPLDPPQEDIRGEYTK